MAKKMSETEKKEVTYAIRRRLAMRKWDYIQSLINGRYFMERCNMIAEQLNKKEIKEKIDGCTKTEGFFLAEYAHQKKQAISSMRDAHFAKQDLIKEYKLTNADLAEIEDDYYNGKIIREDYDGDYNRGKKAEFVNSKQD